MYIPSTKPSVIFPTKAAIPPQSIAAAGTADTGWVQVPPGSKWLSVALNTGALGGGSEQVDVLQAQDNSGTGSKALVTNLITEAGNNKTDDGDVDLDTMDINNGFSYVKVRVTNTGGTGALVGLGAKFGPAPLAA